MTWATCAFRRADFFIGASLHEAIYPPLPPIPYYPHVSFGIVSGSTQLFSLPSCGNHKEIRANGIHLMGRMSDAFPIVPHLTYPPHFGLIMTTLFGSSNMVWGSSSVEMKCFSVFSKHGEDTDIATALGFCVSPHLSCNEPLSFLFDLACVTDATVQVGMSLGDFLACLIDIAIQLAMELGLKALFAGFKVIKGRLSSSKKVLKADKFVKFGDAMDAVQAKSQLDDLLEKGWEPDTVGTKLIKETDEAAKAATESGVWKYGAKQQGYADDALENVADLKTFKSSIDEALESGAIEQSQWDELKKAIDDDTAINLYDFDKASSKLDDIDDAWYETWWKELKKSMTKGNNDALIGSLDSAPSFEAWRQAYLEGSDNLFYRFISYYDSVSLYAQAWAKTGDTWYQKTLYPFARRLYGRTATLLAAGAKAGTTDGSSTSEDENVFYLWGNRQDLIDELNGGGSSGSWSDGSVSSYDRFTWVDASTATTGTTARFGWTAKRTAGKDDQWADETFSAASQDRFAWVPVEETDDADTSGDDVDAG